MTAAALLLAAALLGPFTARTQDASLEPRFGETHLSVGFIPDPVVLAVMAGGGEAMINVADLHLVDADRGNTCGTFYVDETPSLRLVLDGQPGLGFRFLRLFTDVPAGSGTDPALLVQRPDGRWRCADDSQLDHYHGLMPIIDFEDPAPGPYLVWVGSYLRNPAEPAAVTITAHSANLPTQNGY